MAGAALFWVVGDLVYDSFGTDPVLSVADALYLPGYASLLAAEAHFLRVQARQREADSLMEAVMAGLAAFYGVWVLVIEPSLARPSVPLLERVVVGLQPTLSVIVLVLLVQLLMTGTRLAASLLLTLAAGVLLVSDGVYAALQQTSSYTATDLPVLDAGWLAVYALLAAAALHPSMRELVRVRTASPQYGPMRLLVTGASMVTIPLVYVAALLMGHRPHPLSIVLAVMAVVPLVLWRVIRLQREIERSRVYYRSVAQHASDVYLVVDRSGRVVDTSGAVLTLTGAQPQAVVGQPVSALLAEADRELCGALLSKAASRPEASTTHEMRLRTADDGTLWVSARCTNLLDDPAVRGIVVNLHDITGRKRAEEQLTHQALHDPLTGLANRALFRDRIGHALARRRHSWQDVAVLFVDLDGFKTVNDRLGHAAGDDLLETMARRLVAAVRPGDTVARLGGDEFAVLLEGGADLEDQAIGVGERIRRAVSDPCVVGDLTLVVTASVGIAVAGHVGQDQPDDLLRDADTAMYVAKTAGRNQVTRYQPSMRQEVLSRIELEADLRDAVARDELVLQYQPLIELRTRRLIGFEALLRWQHPRRGLLAPGEFVSLAEQSGAILDIGAWVLRTACRAAARWQGGARGEPLTVSVNVSGRQLQDPDLVTHVSEALESSGLPARLLILELTESVLIDQPDAGDRVGDLRALGVRVAIDDFGVGYSSLSYLRQFPVDVLKIHRSFISMIESGGEAPALVHGLFELGQTLELQTVAEGVETDDQLRALLQEGCDLGQGFLFSRPLDEAVAAELAAHPDPGSMLTLAIGATARG